MAKRKIRADFRKGHQGKARRGDLTRELAQDDRAEDRLVSSERVSGKGARTPNQMILGHDVDEASGLSVLLDIGVGSLKVRVLAVFGLARQARTEDGRLPCCATRRVLNYITNDHRHVEMAGDLV